MQRAYPAIIITAGIAFIAMALYFVQLESNLALLEGTTQVAQVSQAGNQNVGIQEITNTKNSLMIDDIKIGTGSEVTVGDTVKVHYKGVLEDGTEFDNSQKRGQPIEFTVGAGQVIAGWEEGLLGMKVGGERVLVIPPEKGYGERGVGPIPPNATLIFTLSLVAIN